MNTIAAIIPFSWAFFTFMPRKGPPYFVRAILPFNGTPRERRRVKSACWPRPGRGLVSFVWSNVRNCRGLVHKLKRLAGEGLFSFVVVSLRTDVDIFRGGIP